VPNSAPRTDAATGVLLVDKPAGITSHGVVARVRVERGVKVGHAGTLDPFATGLLLILLGGATRLQRYLTPLPKVYRATARLGWLSDTGDPDGNLIETGVLPESLELPMGRVTQRVPLTSAIRVRGERLYKRAHRGESIETPEREIEVYRAELLAHEGERAEFEIECAAGTYVRTLIETLGDAYCERLRRVAIGPFSVDDAAPDPLPVSEALGFLPERVLDADEAERTTHGVALAAHGDEGTGPVRLTHAGRLLAIARPRDGEIRPEVVLTTSL
jgi:tRNA pseudouridine55 synthase